MMRRLTIAVLILATGCASRLSGETNEALVRDLVTIRDFDGHAGFGTSDGLKSYGWEAEQVVMERGPEAVPVLVSALRDPALDATQKEIVRSTLGYMGADARAAVPALVEGFANSDTRTTARICMTLGQIGPAADAAIPELMRLLRERRDEVVTPTMSFRSVVAPETRLRTMVAATLGSIGPPAEPALPTLAEGALQTSDAGYRRACRRAMRRILGPEPPVAH